MEQPRLFHAQHLPIRLAYQPLFAHLPTFQPLCPPPSPQGGRPPIDVERAFSRLLTIAMQDLPTRGLDSARNLCTIAHITVLLVALAARRSGCSDQLAFVRSFVPHLIDTVPEKPVL
ncbi:MAG: hypothetical protein ABSE93_07610 [Terriglobia bacterium]|jgi:hypothetical protein